MVWKPAPSTPLVALATTRLISHVLRANGLPGAVFSLLCGAGEVGRAMAADPRIPLVSFTGSTKARKGGGKGREVGVPY